MGWKLPPLKKFLQNRALLAPSPSILDNVLLELGANSSPNSDTANEYHSDKVSEVLA